MKDIDRIAESLTSDPDVLNENFPMGGKPTRHGKKYQIEQRRKSVMKMFDRLVDMSRYEADEQLLKGAEMLEKSICREVRQAIEVLKK